MTACVVDYLHKSYAFVLASRRGYATRCRSRVVRRVTGQGIYTNVQYGWAKRGSIIAPGAAGCVLVGLAADSERGRPPAAARFVSSPSCAEPPLPRGLDAARVLLGLLRQ